MPTSRAALLLIFGLGVAFWPSLHASQPAPEDERRARFRQRSEEFERKGLAEPFRGVTRNGSVQTGLFSIRSTGVSTAPVRQARAEHADVR